jgi:hypothetical protein
MVVNSGPYGMPVKRINQFLDVPLMEEWYHRVGFDRAATPGWPSLEQ